MQMTYDEWGYIDPSTLDQMVSNALGYPNKPKSTKESHMNNVYVTVDDKTYESIGATLKISGDAHCGIEVEVCMSPDRLVNLTPQIKDVIFNPPATIILWSDNTKTVVKAYDDDIYDPEKGIAMAISKKMLGNKYDYYYTFQRYLKRWNKQRVEETANT